ncbi:MAG: hypothetical protein ACI4Q3_01565 [Kiritimatiellia bacterium]
MGKYYVPVFIVVATLSSMLVWRFAPAVGAKLPPSVRASVRRLAAGRGNGSASDDDLATIAAVNRTFDETPDAAAANAAFEASGAKLPPDPQPKRAKAAPAPTPTVSAAPAPVELAARPVVERPAAVALPSAAPDFDPNAEDKSGRAGTPAAAARTLSQRGIVRAALSEDGDPVSWCVLKQVTPIESLEGKDLGTVKGGRFFVIERRYASDHGVMMLVGNFTPRKLPQPVQIAASQVVGYTGDPEKLSEEESNALRDYFELNGAAEERKAKLQADASKRSPYFKPAADALAALRARVRQIEDRTKASDANRKATYELSQLKMKVQELNRKHKEWKERHAAEFPKPESDSVYRDIRARMRDHAKAIAELVD